MLVPWLGRAGGGVHTSASTFARAICRERVGLRIYGGAGPSFNEDKVDWRDTPVTQQVVIGSKSFCWQPALGGALGGFLPHVVHVHGLWTFLSLAASRGALAGVPRLVSPHGMLDTWALERSRWKKRLALRFFELENLRSATCLHALCAQELESIRRMGLVNPVAVIPNGVLCEEERDARQLEAGNLPRHRRIMLFLGRLNPKKGLAELFEAWASALSSQRHLVEPWCLVVAGQGEPAYESALRSEIQRLHLENDVFMVGGKFHEKKRACFDQAEAFILPSYSEGMPMAILEAWSFGLPVLMSRECNLESGFDAGAAMPVSPSRQGLEPALLATFNKTSEELKAMGERGRQLVLRRYNARDHGRELTCVYEWLAGCAERPVSVVLD